MRGVLVTHMHFDHVGLAGRVRQASGAWIAMHPADQAVFARPDYRSAERAVTVEAEFLCGLGASPAEAATAVGTAAEWEKFTTIAQPDRLLTDGELADVPGWKLRAVHTPGHTPGHLCFVDERSRRLFSGDHVLPRITPNISVQRGAPPDPLGDYLGSLARTRDLDVDEVLPAHEWRFRGLPGRVDAITAHHERRLAELLAAIRRRPGSTPWQLAGDLDLVPALGPVQRPDADLCGHRDRRARAPAGAPRRGDREPDPAARVHGEGHMTGTMKFASAAASACPSRTEPQSYWSGYGIRRPRRALRPGPDRFPRPIGGGEALAPARVAERPAEFGLGLGVRGAAGLG